MKTQVTIKSQVSRNSVTLHVQNWSEDNALTAAQVARLKRAFNGSDMSLYVDAIDGVENGFEAFDGSKCRPWQISVGGQDFAWSIYAL